MGGGDDPDVDLAVLLLAHRAHLALLQHAQELGLGVGGELAHLVEQDGAGVGLAEEPWAGANGAGEGPFGVAEQLGFGELRGEGGAVEAHEGPVGAPGGEHDGLGHPLLAGAALAGDEDGDVAGRHPSHQDAQAAHGFGGEDHRAGQGQLALELLVLPDEPHRLDGAANHGEELLGLEGLLEVVVGSGLHGLDGIPFRAMGGAFTVTYNGNGSTGGSVPVDANAYPAGATVTVLGNAGSLVRGGYTFTGWNTQANGSGVGYASGVTFVMGSAGVTLFAQWSANPTYTVTYAGNGSTSGAAPSDPNNYLTGALVTVLNNTGSLARSGYTFVGWNTNSNGSGTSYAGGVTFAMGSASVTLFAQWSANPTYTVVYNGNGNTGGTAPIDANSYLAGTTVTTRGVGNLSRTGYVFTGWNTASNGGGISYATGATFAIGAASVTLYAQWTLISTYTVTYNANAGTGSVPVDANAYPVGAAVTVLGNTGGLTRAGYTFAGWNTQGNGTGISYPGGSSFVMGSVDVTLYAQWTQVPTFNVVYSGNGSTGGSAPGDPNNYIAGATVTVLGNTGNLTRSGYTFAGWNTKADGSGTLYAGGATFAIGATSITLYAQWTIVPTFTVTYAGNGSTGGNPPTDANSYPAGSTVVVANSGTLSRAGYSFTGWNVASGGTGQGYAAGATFTMGSANVTLYAQWTQIATFTVTYGGNGSTGGSVPVDGNSYTAGSTVTVLGNTGSLVRAGYTFTGWNTQANGSGISYPGGSLFTIGSSSVVLYAQWSPTFTVTYNGNGSTAGGVPGDASHYLTGATVTVLDNTGSLARAGYIFAGWNTKADGTGTPYAGGATFTMGSASVVLYAQWTIQTFSVSYNGNGSTGGSAPTDANNYASGATVTVAGSGTLSRPGYLFAGWNTASNGSGSAYAPGATFSMGSANVTLYAQWTQTYTVTYDGNGNTGGTAPTDAAQYTAGQTVTVLDNGSLVNGTSNFAGWSEQQNATTPTHLAGDTFAMPSNNVTLFAVWQ